MKKMGVVLALFLSLGPCAITADNGPPYYSSYKDYAGYKWVTNRTGWPIYFTFYPQQLDPFSRFPQTFTYYMEPNAKKRLKYPGKTLFSFSWWYEGAPQPATYFYSDADKATNATVIVLKPRGRADLA